MRTRFEINTGKATWVNMQFRGLGLIGPCDVDVRLDRFGPHSRGVPDPATVRMRHPAQLEWKRPDRQAAAGVSIAGIPYIFLHDVAASK